MLTEARGLTICRQSSNNLWEFLCHTSHTGLSQIFIVYCKCNKQDPSHLPMSLFFLDFFGFYSCYVQLQLKLAFKNLVRKHKYCKKNKEIQQVWLVDFKIVLYQTIFCFLFQNYKEDKVDKTLCYDNKLGLKTYKVSG